MKKNRIDTQTLIGLPHEMVYKGHEESWMKEIVSYHFAMMAEIRDLLEEIRGIVPPENGTKITEL